VHSNIISASPHCLRNLYNNTRKKTKDLVEWYNLFITFHKRAAFIIPETIFTICVTLTIKIGGKKKEDKCGMFGEVNRVVFV
jgi:hypothetical protein